MALIESTGTFTSRVLIGDGVNGALATPTLVNGVAISSCLELQSTTGAFTLPRMTSAQLAAIPNPINGMIAYNTDTNLLVRYNSGTPGFISTTQIFSLASIGVQAVNIESMYAAPFQLIAPTGVGTAIVPLLATLYYTADGAQYGAGGIMKIQYGNTIHAGGTNAFSSTIEKELLVGNNNNSIMVLDSSFSNIAAPANTGLYMSNATNNFNSTGPNPAVLKVNIWYNIITTT